MKFVSDQNSNAKLQVFQLSSLIFPNCLAMQQDPSLTDLEPATGQKWGNNTDLTKRSLMIFQMRAKLIRILGILTDSCKMLEEENFGDDSRNSKQGPFYQ